MARIDLLFSVQHGVADKIKKRYTVPSATCLHRRFAIGEYLRSFQNAMGRNVLVKRFTVIAICILLFCVGVFYVVSIPHNLLVSDAKGGTLNLTNADFTKFMYTLDGEWEFYHGQLYAPEDFASDKAEGGVLTMVPVSWDIEGYPITGYATYRLTVQAAENELMLYIPTIVTSSKVWVNGGLVSEAGITGKTESEAIVGRRNSLVTVSPKEGKLELVIWVSNFDYMEAGLKHSMFLGTKEIVQPRIYVRAILLALFLGGVIVLGMYHMFLYFSNDKDRVYLVFALFCLSAVIRFLFENNSLVVLFFEIGKWSQYIYMPAVEITCGFLALSTHEAFKIPYSKPLVAVYALFTLGLMVMPFFIPFASFNKSFFLLSIVPLIIAWVLAVQRRAQRKNPYDILYLISMFIFILWGPINKMLMDFKYFVPGVASHIFLIICQCIMLALSYAETKRQREELARRADFYHRMAHDLLTPLTVVSTSIQVAAVLPEEAPQQLKDSQAEIMKMAEMINDALIEEDGE
jgi:hypothetical protein